MDDTRGQPRSAFIVKILRSDGEAVGVGTLIAPGAVVTCAHVINAARGLEAYAASRPADDHKFQVEFPLLSQAGPGPRVRAGVAAWLPLGLDGSGDVAGLRLLDPQPEGAAPAKLRPLLSEPEPATIFGYPRLRASGVWSTATIRGLVGLGGVQLEDNLDAAVRVQAGFSGSPLIVNRDGHEYVVGMFSMAGTSKNVRDSSGTSLTRLAEAWPELLRLSSMALAPSKGYEQFQKQLLLALRRSAPRVGYAVTPQLTQHRKDIARHHFGLPGREQVLATFTAATWARLLPKFLRSGMFRAVFTNHRFVIDNEHLTASFPYSELAEFNIYQHTEYGTGDGGDIRFLRIERRGQPVLSVDYGFNGAFLHGLLRTLQDRIGFPTHSQAG